MSLLKPASDGNLTGIKAILSNVRRPKQKVRERDNHNWTCLHHAVKSGSVECIEYLLTIKELDTTAETYEGETALHLACCTPNVSIEIVSMLLEANKDLVNFVNNEEVDLLHCAILHKRLDIVQLLIHHGAPVNHQDLDGDTALHIAAHELQVEIIRYLLYESDCDPTICNSSERTACFLLFPRLVHKLEEHLPLLQEEIDCFEELVLFIYDKRDPDDYKIELYEMVNVWHRLSLPLNRLYIVIVNIFKVTQQRQYFIQKIFQLNIPFCYCVICNLIEAPSDYLSVDFPSNFICEMLSVFLLDESFFEECLSEIMGSGRMFESVIRRFTTIKKETVQPQQMFNFWKHLILYDIDIDLFVQIYRTDFLNVFAPLVNFVTPSVHKYRNVIYNETENLLNVYTGTPRPAIIHDRVVSLMTLSRRSVRSYYFSRYSHYNALKALYTLNIKIQIRNFLCFNYINLKF